MNQQEYVAAQQSAIGGGTLIENADKSPARGLSAEAQEIIVTLSDAILFAQQLRQAVIRQDQEPITRDEARRLSRHMITKASAAYRLLRIAIGDPMFRPEELLPNPILTDAEADQPDREIVERWAKERGQT